MYLHSLFCIYEVIESVPVEMQTEADFGCAELFGFAERVQYSTLRPQVRLGAQTCCCGDHDECSTCRKTLLCSFHRNTIRRMDGEMLLYIARCTKRPFRIMTCCCWPQKFILLNCNKRNKVCTAARYHRAPIFLAPVLRHPLTASFPPPPRLTWLRPWVGPETPWTWRSGSSCWGWRCLGHRRNGASAATSSRPRKGWACSGSVRWTRRS